MPTMSARSGMAELDWLLNGLIDRVAGATRAVVLSADGLLMARSRALSAPDAEHLSAVASALQCLSQEAGRHFGGGDVRQTVVEMDHAYLLVTAAGSGASIALLAGEAADLGMLAYETNLLVSQVGMYLSAAPRGARIAPRTA